MAKLVLRFNGDVIKEYEIDKEVISIGRKPDNDIHIDNLAVSGKHAKILTILNDSFIEDLDSTNGTFVNDNKINKHALKNGECITVGEHELTYINDEAEDADDSFENTMVIRTGVTRDKEETGPDNSQATAKLQLVSGANAGKELELTKIITTLGKPDVQVAAITRRPAGYFLIVVDAGKENRMPLVNDAEIDKQQQLNDNDVIEVAGTKMRFNLL